MWDFSKIKKGKENGVVCDSTRLQDKRQRSCLPYSLRNIRSLFISYSANSKHGGRQYESFYQIQLHGQLRREYC